MIFFLIPIIFYYKNSKEQPLKHFLIGSILAIALIHTLNIYSLWALRDDILGLVDDINENSGPIN